MLKKWPKAARFALAAFVSFFFATLAGLLVDSWKNDDVVFLMLPFILAFIFFSGATIGCLAKGAVRLLLRSAPVPGVRTYTAADLNGHTRTYVYNRADTFRFRTGTELNWPGCVLMYSILTPVGLFLIWRKLSFEHGRRFRNGTVLTVMGIVYALPLLGLLTALVACGDTQVSALAGGCLVFGLWGLPALLFVPAGLCLRASGALNAQLMALLTEERISRIDELSQRMGRSYAWVSDRIERLCDLGLLPGAYISHPDGEVIMPGISRKLAVRCRMCAATTVLYTTEERVCCFCGARL